MQLKQHSWLVFSLQIDLGCYGAFQQAMESPSAAVIMSSPHHKSTVHPNMVTSRSDFAWKRLCSPVSEVSESKFNIPIHKHEVVFRYLQI